MTPDLWDRTCETVSDNQVSKPVLYSQLTEGQHLGGWQQKKFKDTMKTNLKKCNITINTWESQTLNQPKWCCDAQQGIDHLDQTCLTMEAARQDKQRERAVI